MTSVEEQRARTLDFEFRGDGYEFFKIWIVNIMLSILTLGVYSAWAKVRTNRYFYSSLYLDGANFRYLAEPLAILRGRIIAVTIFTILYYLFQYNYQVALVLLAVLLPMFPVIYNQALAFQRRMSSYRNIQFRFNGNYLDAFMVMYGWPLLGLLTLGILYPLALLRMNQYLVRNSSYGTANLEFTAGYGDYARILLFLFIPAAAFLFLILAVALSNIPYSVAVSSALGYIGGLAAAAYLTVAFTNLYYRNLILREHRFEATLKVTSVAFIMVTNSLLIVATLGLYLPVAKVRMTRYICDNITMHARGSLDDFVAAEEEKISALGEELGAVFDI